jgi:hypothetical protein
MALAVAMKRKAFSRILFETTDTGATDISFMVVVGTGKSSKFKV